MQLSLLYTPESLPPLSEIRSLGSSKGDLKSAKQMGSNRNHRYNKRPRPWRPTYLSLVARPKWHRLNPNPGTGRPRPSRLLLHLASDGQAASSSARVILYRTTSQPPSASRRLLPLPRVAVVSRSERQAPLRRNGACGLAPDLPLALSDSH